MADSFEQRLATAIAESLAGIENLQESAFMLGNAQVPSAEVLSGPIEFDEAFARGLDKYIFTVRVTTGTSIAEAAQLRLRELRAPSGASSIKAALETDRSFGLDVTSRVTRMSANRLFQRPGGQQVMGFDVELEVHADGNQD